MPKPTLLYAEDDRETRENYTYFLRPYFQTIYTASNGKEALKLYYDKQPNILLLDISMPLLNGLDLAKIIRKEDSDTPIIMLTAHSDTEKLLQAIELKLETYLLKPIDDIRLKETIIRVIRKMEEKEVICLRNDLTYNKATEILSYKGMPVKITKKERLLLQILIRHAGKYVSHDELILHVWHNDIPDHSHDNKLIQLIYRFNRKLTHLLSSDRHLIENSYTLGYRISCL